VLDLINQRIWRCLKLCLTTFKHIVRSRCSRHFEGVGCPVAVRHGWPNDRRAAIDWAIERLTSWPDIFRKGIYWMIGYSVELFICNSQQLITEKHTAFDNHAVLFDLIIFYRCLFEDILELERFSHLLCVSLTIFWPISINFILLPSVFANHFLLRLIFSMRHSSMLFVLSMYESTNAY